MSKIYQFSDKQREVKLKTLDALEAELNSLEGILIGTENEREWWVACYDRRDELMLEVDRLKAELGIWDWYECDDDLFLYDESADGEE